MKTLKVGLLALSTLALSSAAMAHGWDRGHRESRHDYRHEVRYEQRHEDRYAGRYGCEAPTRVVYVQPRVAVRPGVRVNVSFGF